MYALEVKTKAQKQLESLPKKDQQRVLAVFDVLRENPAAGKKLEGKYKGFRSLRAWPYRIIYAIDHSIITVTVVKIGHRKDVYK
ncbi:MAG: type II toxin-antitoxin system RelE/ParE family toxin [Candidatus Peribacteraceae bacterium]|nr:type II toxin-antitoxin system RelE/ParE family toxin [Candidatus Peribacteraceae bacterium]MDD5742834.1 type II toxin-antitoxin system RelE/ParE family toxin [Candidatus Peribacteraceae bacterium]